MYPCMKTIDPSTMRGPDLQFLINAKVGVMAHFHPYFMECVVDFLLDV